MARLDLYLERVEKRVFAGAIEWPGLDRSGRDDAAALEALARAIPRYRPVVERAGVADAPPEGASLEVVEEVRGDAGTDFGIPSVGPPADERPATATALRRLTALLEAAWAEFDGWIDRAGDRELRKGPRGGGRDVPRLLTHVLDADKAYLRSIGGRKLRSSDADQRAELARVRDAALEALPALARGEPIEVSARRTAELWTPRYYVRRAAWHALDHAWEIEDRIEPA